MEEEIIKELLSLLEGNNELYIKDVIKFILYRETGVWEGEKPTGKWLDKRIRRYFEKPVIDFINENNLN